MLPAPADGRAQAGDAAAMENRKALITSSKLAMKRTRMINLLLPRNNPLLHRTMAAAEGRCLENGGVPISGARARGEPCRPANTDQKVRVIETALTNNQGEPQSSLLGVKVLVNCRSATPRLGDEPPVPRLCGVSGGVVSCLERPSLLPLQVRSSLRVLTRLRT